MTRDTYFIICIPFIMNLGEHRGKTYQTSCACILHTAAVLSALRYWTSLWRCHITGGGGVEHSKFISYCLPLNSIASASLITSLLEQSLIFWAVWAALSGCWAASGTMGGSYFLQEGSSPRRKCLDYNRDRTIGNHGEIRPTSSRHREDPGGSGTWNFHPIIIDYWQVPSQIRACNEPQTLLLLGWLHVSVVVKLYVLHEEQCVKCCE